MKFKRLIPRKLRQHGNRSAEIILPKLGRILCHKAQDEYGRGLPIYTIVYLEQPISAADLQQPDLPPRLGAADESTRLYPQQLYQSRSFSSAGSFRVWSAPGIHLGRLVPLNALPAELKSLMKQDASELPAPPPPDAKVLRLLRNLIRKRIRPRGSGRLKHEEIFVGEFPQPPLSDLHQPDLPGLPPGALNQAREQIIALLQSGAFVSCGFRTTDRKGIHQHFILHRPYQPRRNRKTL